MTAEDLEDLVKKKFRIQGSDLDEDISDSVEAAVDTLSPYVEKAVTNDEATADSDDQSFDLPSAVSGADLIAIFSKSSGDIWTKFSDYVKFEDTIYLKAWVEDGTQFRLHVRQPFTIDDIADVPIKYKRGLVDAACAEFATVLAGDKTKYNIYAQSNGARAVDNMLDLADYYERKAVRRFERLSAGEALS